MFLFMVFKNGCPSRFVVCNEWNTVDQNDERLFFAMTSSLCPTCCDYCIKREKIGGGVGWVGMHIWVGLAHVALLLHYSLLEFVLYKVLLISCNFLSQIFSMFNLGCQWQKLG